MFDMATEINDKFKILKELEEQKSKAYEDAFEKYNELKEQYNKKIIELFNYENKYLKITHLEDISYIICDEVFKYKDLSDRNAILIRGYGFTSLFTPYADATYVRWDEFFEHNIYIDDNYDIAEQIKEITEITPDEFNQAFETMVGKLISKHTENMDFYKKQLNQDEK